MMEDSPGHGMLALAGTDSSYTEMTDPVFFGLDGLGLLLCSNAPFTLMNLHAAITRIITDIPSHRNGVGDDTAGRSESHDEGDDRLVEQHRGD